MFCPNCGYMNYDDARYCHKCHMTLRPSSYADSYNGDSYTGTTQRQYVSQQVEPNAQQQTYPAASPYTVYSANNASNGSPAPKSYKLPIILVSVVLAVLVAVSGVVGYFVFFNKEESLPPYENTVHQVFADVKSDGFVAGLQKHMLIDPLSGLSKDEKTLVKMMEPLLSSITWTCSDVHAISYYDCVNDKAVDTGYTIKDDSVVKHLEYEGNTVKNLVYSLREQGVIKNSDIIVAYVRVSFDVSVSGHITFLGHSQDVNETSENQTMDLLFINGEWKIVSSVINSMVPSNSTGGLIE